jgi:hypothetical protein
MYCATIDTLNYVVVNTNSVCAANELLLLTKTEFDYATSNFLSIDNDAGALIAGAILAIWTIGFGFRALIRALSIDGKTSNSESDL